MSDDETLQGVYTGTAPDEARLDPLDIISGLATHVAWSLIAKNKGLGVGASDRAEVELLNRARKLLVLNARYVPQTVDEVVDNSGIETP